MFLIDVTVKEIDFDLTGPDDLPMAEFTVEVGTPTLALKGTFAEYLIPDPSGHNSPEVKGRWNTEGNLTTCGDGTGFNSFLKACEQQLTESWVHAHGIDFRDAILNELELALHHPQCDERTGSGGSSCICHRLPGGHALTPEPEPETLMSIWCGGALWFLTRKACSNLEATALMIADSPSGPYTEDGRAMTPTEVMESREYLSRELRYSYHVVNLTACIADGIDPHRDWCGQSTYFDDVARYLTRQTDS